MIRLRYPFRVITDRPLARSYTSAFLSHIALSTRINVIDASFSQIYRVAALKSRREDGYLCSLGHAAMRAAAACDWRPRQHRVILVGDAYRLAAALPSLTYVALSLRHEHGRVAQRVDIPSREPKRDFTTSKTVPSQLLQVVFSEITPCTEKSRIGLTFLMVVIFQGGVLDTADEVGNLGKTIVAWIGIAIHQGLSSERILKSLVQRSRYQTLPVIVIDFDDVVLLKPFQVFKQELDDVALHLHTEGITVCELSFSIRKCFVAKRDSPDKRGEAQQIPSAKFDAFIFEAIIAVRQQHKMERLVLQFPIIEQLLIVRDLRCDIVFLVVENERQDVILGIPAQVTGFINENGKLTHRQSLQKQESRGGIPRPSTDLLVWKPI